ncbi:MAG TPA: glycoside hydrolase family 75 protein [Bacteroidia bacterium]|nr:glycoside hydrolase family 75 protein [Bacteroidia bacterium]
MSNRIFLPVLFSVLLFSFAWMEFKSGNKKFLVVGKTQLWQDTINNTVFFTSGMNIDADGSPRAYHPVSDSGSDKLANAGSNGKWWGIATNEKGEPFIQTKTDPAPGFYVSCTALQDGSKKISDPVRYVNSDSIPYIVLPNSKTILAEIKMGDIAFVKNLRNGRSSYAICADVGSKDKIGEGSIALADSLGINSSPRKGGTRDSVLYIVFPGSGNGQIKNRATINFIGQIRFQEGMVNYPK